MAKLFYSFILGSLLWVFGAHAAIPNKDKYDKYFAVDLSVELPDYQTLLQEYNAKHTPYDRRYKWHWDIGNVFDGFFRSVINTYGGTERRVKGINEDALLHAIQLLPPQYYQYIGPFLHTVPGISDKILNMPGIKETKNKFPTRLAPQVQNIKNLEYLSPYLYFLLMPEAWPGNPETIEYPQIKEVSVRQAPDSELFERVEQMVPFEEFMSASSSKPVDESNLRTIEISKNSPLTSGDIKAFVKTLPELNKIKSDINVMSRLYTAGTLLDDWEKEQGMGLPINGFKDFIYPCSRLVQKMRLAGEDRFLKMTVSKSGFTPEEWAYTCDKTIRAYRLVTLSAATAQSLKAYALGVDNEEIRKILGDEMAEIQFLNMQAAMRMHESSRHDVLEVYKNRKMLGESFDEAGYAIVTAPIFVSN